MVEILKKLKSRKFLTCVAGVVMGLCMTFGLDENAVNIIAGSITALGSIVTYIYTEGKIDAEAVKNAADEFEEIKNTVEQIKD